ncbi:MAG: spore coat protein [Dethiobacteria bacterium]|jgi:similar to spore coat protein
MNLNQNQTDQFIATELLIGAKSAVRNYAYALTETASSEVKNILKKHLNSAIEFHDGVSNYMINKGYYIPHDVNRQIQMDIQNAQALINSQASIPAGVRS